MTIFEPGEIGRDGGLANGGTVYIIAARYNEARHFCHVHRLNYNDTRRVRIVTTRQSMRGVRLAEFGRVVLLPPHYSDSRPAWREWERMCEEWDWVVRVSPVEVVEE